MKFIVIILILILLGYIGLGLWGLVIAFQSHLITGAVVLVINPLAPAVGLLDGVFSVGLVDSITNVINKIGD